MFCTSIKVNLADTDAAGRLFYSRLLDMMHTTYEECLEEKCWPLARILSEEDFILTITRVEVEYHHPIQLGDKLMIALEINEIRMTSFSLSYSITAQDEKTVATALTVHTAVAKDTGKKIPLPARFMDLFTANGML